MLGNDKVLDRRRILDQVSPAPIFPFEPLSTEEKSVERGDLLISVHDLPNPNDIYPMTFETDERAPGEKISVSALTGYLEFLEQLIVNQRVVVVGYNVFSSEPKDVLESDEVEFGLVRLKIKPYRDDLAESAFSLFRDHGILDCGLVTLSKLAPSDFISRHLPVVSGLIEDFRRDLYRSYPKETALRERALELWTLNEIGVPLYLTEFARTSALPLKLAAWEVSNLLPVDSVERTLRTTVMAHLKGSLDKAVAAEAGKLRAFATPVEFPATAIAAQLVRESSSIEDLPRVAWEMRQSFEHLRHWAEELEAELVSPESSMKRRMRAYRELEALSGAIGQSGFQVVKEAVPLTDLLSTMIEPVRGPQDIQNLAKQLVGGPIETLRRGVRRHKVRVLIRSKTEALRSGDWLGELARISGVSVQSVQESARG